MDIIALFVIVIIVFVCIIIVYNSKSKESHYSRSDKKTNPLKRYSSINELAEGIKRIERLSFYHKNMKSAVIPSTVIAIGSDAFRECEDLVSVSIPDSVAYIGIRAFYGCVSLETIDIGTGIKEIQPRAFGNCSSIQEFHIKATIPPIVRGAYILPFHKIKNPDTCTLYVPIGYSDTYRNKDGWKDFMHIVEE